MKAYYGSRISENMTMTPEGFLICLAVPVARCGVQEYLPEELGMDGETSVEVTRLPGDVFSACALSSFEGKPVTLNHPPSGVEPQNACAYQKGHAQNIRRGADGQDDLMLADLFVTDPEVIRLIRFGGVREISCGYECEYEKRDDGRILQRGIRGNHIAVVMRGRAGSRVAIKDSIQRGGKRHMKKSEKSTMFSRMFAGWARDAEPEEVAQAVEELCEGALTDTELPEAEPQVDCACEGTMGELIRAIENLIRKLDEQALVRDEDDPMAKLLCELSGEAAATISEDEEEIVEGDEETLIPEEAASDDETQGAEVAMAAIKAIQPIIAQLPEAEQFAAADAAARQIRRAMGRPARPRTNGYKLAVRGHSHGFRRAARDASDLGREIMASRNPHYRNNAR